MEEYFMSTLVNVSTIQTNCCLGDISESLQYNQSANLTQKDNFHSNGVKPLFNVLMSVVLILIIVTSLVGNLLVCCAICVNDHFRSSATYYFIFSLAVSDLLTASLSMTFDADLMLTGSEWKYGEIVCNIYTTIYSIAVPTSILNLLAVSVDRYKSLSDPLNRFRESRFMTRRRALTVIACLWLYCVVFSLIPVMGWKIYPQSVINGYCFFNMSGTYSVISSFLNFLLPLLIMCIIYCRISIIAQNINNLQTQNVRSTATPAISDHNVSASGKHLNRKFVKNVKAAKNVLLIVACFFLCWIPHTILSIVGVFCKDCYAGIPPEVFHSLLVMGYLNSSLNPVIYSLQNRRFQETYKRMFGIRQQRPADARIQSNSTRLSLISSRYSSVGASHKYPVARTRCNNVEQPAIHESTL